MKEETTVKYIKEILGKAYDKLESALKRKNNLVDRSPHQFIKEMKKIYPNSYESLTEDITTLINKKKGTRRQSNL